ncbi:unnamed protein product [Symbiodinium microadriaticum]|nr:unnamed protein product [Symbiodinium microadriaticum]
MLKKFSKFYTFWMSLPVGSTRHLKNPFPKTGLFQFVDESNQALDERTTLLDEWCRELCLDEKCMTNPKILSALDQFFISAQVTAPLIGDIEPDNMDSWIVIPENTVKSIPVPLATLQRNLPTKIDPSLLFGSCRNSMAFAGSITGSDLSEDQLRKDLSRDRIVMQGRRIAGATSSLEAIIDLGVNTAQAVTTLHNVKPFGEDLLRDLCRRALVQVSRTESAFASHYALQAILDPSTDPNIIILPEASLAKPLLMQFRVAPSSDTTPGPRRSNTSTENDEDAGASTTAVRPRRMSALAKMGKAMSVSQGDVPAESIGPLESKDLICDIQATTVFRFVAADSMETTVLQVRVTFCKSMKVKQPGENEESALFAKTCLNPFGEDSPRPAGSTNPFGADSVDVGDDNKGVGDFPRTPSADNEDLCACPERPEVSRFNHLYLDSNTVIVIEQDTHLTSRDFV